MRISQPIRATRCLLRYSTYFQQYTSAPQTISIRRLIANPDALCTGKHNHGPSGSPPPLTNDRRGGSSTDNCSRRSLSRRQSSASVMACTISQINPLTCFVRFAASLRRESSRLSSVAVEDVRTKSSRDGFSSSMWPSAIRGGRYIPNVCLNVNRGHFCARKWGYVGVEKHLVSAKLCEANYQFVEHLCKTLNWRISRSRMVDELIGVVRSQYSQGYLVLTPDDAQALLSTPSNQQINFDFR